MTSDGAEIRFWTYFDNTTNQAPRRRRRPDASTTPPAPSSSTSRTTVRCQRLHLQAGNPNGYTTDAYTPVGTYTTGWTQYRLVMNFTGPRPTRSRAALSATDAWTPIKAPGATGYAIPMLSASTVTATHGTRWRSYYAARRCGSTT